VWVEVFKPGGKGVRQGLAQRWMMGQGGSGCTGEGKRE